MVCTNAVEWIGVGTLRDFTKEISIRKYHVSGNVKKRRVVEILTPFPHF
jgi:hypothetical protein